MSYNFSNKEKFSLDLEDILTEERREIEKEFLKDIPTTILSEKDKSFASNLDDYTKTKIVGSVDDHKSVAANIIEKTINNNGNKLIN